MKISIITVTYNNEAYIEACIKSVISQSYGNIEHIIVDGKSTDGTMDIVNRYKDKITKILSEKDNGYVYAMNKGLRMASGDVIGFLHSDDFYADDQVIEKVVDAFKEGSFDSLYGDLIYVRQNNPDKIVRYWKGGVYDPERIKNGWMPPHPTFFVREKIYKRYGYFNTDFKIAADYELMVRFLHKYRISSYYMPYVMVKMRLGGASNKGFKNIIRKSLEDYKACKIYGIKRKLLVIILKNISKVAQFFTKGSRKG